MKNGFKYYKSILIFIISFSSLTANAAGWSNRSVVVDYWCQSSTVCFVSGNFQNALTTSCGQNAFVIDASGGVDDFKNKLSMVMISFASQKPLRCWVDKCASYQGTTYLNCSQAGISQ